MHARSEPLAWCDSRQIDARHLCTALRQLLTAATLEREALEELAIDPAVVRELTEACERFEGKLPGAKVMRDGLTHFEDWSRGTGRGPQKERLKTGQTHREVARHFWGFGYDPAADTVTMGPYSFNATEAARAAGQLFNAIYKAAREVDRCNTARRRAAVLNALSAAGITSGPGEAVLVSNGDDTKVWLSMARQTDLDEHAREDLTRRAVTALTRADLTLTAVCQDHNAPLAQRLAQGETLLIE
ncbi:hypothetical protein ACIQPR_08940 [Streptomyces sp. NPDC091280]|uniref:hypothetical protein n=1 Tax=Streptomyces sp. NPDC091280 TaxID=3365984 RepID=UPI0037F69050